MVEEAVGMAKNPENAGFSLIELLVVIVVMGILTSIAFPVIYKAFLSGNTVQRAAKQLEADFKTAQNMSVSMGGGDMSNGVLVRRSVFVVFSTSANSYQTYTYEDTNGNGVRDANEATQVGTTMVLPKSVIFGTAAGVTTNACWNNSTSGTAFGVNGGQPGGSVPQGCGGSSPCVEIDSNGFPVPDNGSALQVGGTVYLTNNIDTFAVNMNAAGLLTVCKWPQGAGAWEIVR